MDGIDYDSKDYRKLVWDKEYSTTRNLPTSKTFNPSTSLKRFLIEYPDINRNTALDIGCGNGRNSFYLAENGFSKVIGYDISESAIKIAGDELSNRKLEEKIEFFQGDVTDNYDSFNKYKYDLIIDMMTLHTLSSESRSSLFELIKANLNPGGYYILFTISSDSDYVPKFVSKHKGFEPNSYFYDSNGTLIPEKTFALTELQNALKPLNVISHDSFQMKTDVYGVTVSRKYLKVIFKNSSI